MILYLTLCYGSIWKSVLKYVFNFRDPAYDHFPELDNIEWPEAHGRNFSFLKIQKVMTIERGGLYPERMEFWDLIAKQLIADDSEFEGLDLFEDKPELEDEEQWFEGDEMIDAEEDLNNLEEDGNVKEAESSDENKSESLKPKQQSSESRPAEETDTEDQIQSPETVKDEL